MLLNPSLSKSPLCQPSTLPSSSPPVQIVAELGGTTLLKASKGFSRVWPGVGAIALYSVAVVLLSFSLRGIALCIAYATWSGIGTGDNV